MSEDTEEYDSIPISPQDTITVKLTHTFIVGGQTQWATAEANISALTDETSDEVSERAQAIALGTVFQAADNLSAIIDERRAQQKAARSIEGK